MHRRYLTHALQPSMEEDIDPNEQFLDHGMSAASKSAHQLALAVNSIPAYARASSLMLVLTPFIRHKVSSRRRNSQWYMNDRGQFSGPRQHL